MTQATVSNRLPPSYRHWEKNLRLKMANKPLVNVHDGDPHPGYYRAKRKGEWVAGFVRFDQTGTLICRVANEMVDPIIAWADLAAEPIEREACETWFATGRWPGVDEAKPAQQETGEVSAGATPVGAQASPVSIAAPAAIGHNGGPSIVEELTEATDRLRHWLKSIGNKITTDEHERIAANMIGRIRELISKAEKEHTIQKAPHLEAGRAVDKIFNPPIKTGSDAVKHTRTLLAAKKQAEFEAAEEARRKAAEAHAKKVAAAEKKGKAPPPPPVIAAQEPQTKIQSDTGRALSFRQEAVLEIDDIGALFDRYQNYPEVAELFLKLARRDWKETGHAPVGTRITQAAKVA